MSADTDPPAAVLDDSSPPADPAAVFALLDGLGIEHHTVHHPPVYTVEQARSLRGNLAGGHSKNLFLKNKQGRMWLVTCEESAAVDLNALADRIGAGRLSFASSRRLMSFLGVIPGAVTPFALINDRGARVQMVLDSALLDCEMLNFHPLDNTMTTQILAADLMRFLDALQHEPTLVELDRQFPVP